MKINKNLIINKNDNINIMRDKVYQNSVNHGWHETKRSVSEYCALFHSEASEILEEFRMEKPKELYFVDTKKNVVVNCEYHYVDMAYIDNDFDKIKDCKPCGYGIELADLVIRLLDFCGEELIHINIELENKTPGSLSGMSVAPTTRS